MHNTNLIIFPCRWFSLQKVAQFLAIGPYTDRMPNRPTLPSGGKIEYMVAFPNQPSRTAEVNWLLLSSDKDIG